MSTYSIFIIFSLRKIIDNDKLIIKIDLIKYELSYIINEKNYGKAFDIEKQEIYFL